MDDHKIEELAKVLSRQIDKEVFARKYAPAKEILKLVGAGAFLVGSFAVPTLPLALKPFFTNENEYEVWKRFNIPYLKRTLTRLEKQKLVEITEADGKQVVKITRQGRQKILRMSLDTFSIPIPKNWDRKWRLVSFDIPVSYTLQRKIFVEYLSAWKFYPFNESVYLHAYPCLKEVDFLREYLGIGEYVRLLVVTDIENDDLFRDYFGV